MTKKDEKTTDKDTKKSTKKAEKKTLVELVESLTDVSLTSIVMDLSQNGLLDQYREELSLKEQGIPIIPSITEAEFKKIIGD